MHLAHQALLLLLLVALGSCASDAGGEYDALPRIVLRADFEPAKEGSELPPGWVLTETNGRGTPAAWGVGPGHARSRGLVVIENSNPEATFSLALWAEVKLRDFDARVRLHAWEGVQATGGGLCFRVGDRDHYYAALWNAAAHSLDLVLVEAGRSRVLQSAAVDASADTWHELGVSARGREIRVSLDDRTVIALEDGTLRDAGPLALVVRADARTWFDDLRVW